MGNHPAELAKGAAIPVDTVTTYLCLRNHLFFVIGPHVVCKCEFPIICQIIEERELNVDGSLSQTFRTGKSWSCCCRAGVKRLAATKAQTLRTAAAVYLLEGWRGVADVLKIKLHVEQTRHGVTYIHPPVAGSRIDYPEDRGMKTFPGQAPWLR